ncbi:MAG: tRNA pseudouridine38-40 synthase [Marinoscillum sp.]|jgi:tRNA pseudouridine38-40 synthase
MRYFLDISYLGTAYHGWQIQQNANTVQAEINRALSLLLQEDLACLGSGRTDTGVHASQQIAHVDLSELKFPVSLLQVRLNTVLPNDISINNITLVHDESHARFDATKRTYHYHISKSKNPFQIRQSYHFTRPLNVHKIQQALEVIKKTRDFQAFSKVHTEVNNFDCEIFDVYWRETNDSYTFCVSANRFLRGMVRAMAGTLLDVGIEKISLEEFKSILESGDRSKAGRSVPAEGLFLSKVEYPNLVYLAN